MGVTHALAAGRAACGLPGGPHDWPESHGWVDARSPAAMEVVSCLACRQAILTALRPLDSQLERLQKAEELVRWMAQTVHQAHHEGDLQACGKSTCRAAQQFLAR